MSKIKRMYTMHTHDHGGWTDEEDELLFTAVAEAKRTGRPLRSAFDEVAQKANRRPNSIRNYYYLRIRDDDVIKRFSPCRASTFVPFEDADVRSLLRRILSDQAKGISVRSSTMALANGDMTNMLRYQNKYRSLLKSDSALVCEIAEELRAEGLPSFNPYSDTPVHRAGRPKKEAVTAREKKVQRAIDRLYEVDGLDVTALFECLGALAESAGRGAEALKTFSQNGTALNAAKLRDENAELRQMLQDRDAELREKTKDVLAMTEAMSELLGINKEFLELSGVSKVSYLSNYVRELSGAVQKCVLPEAN